MRDPIVIQQLREKGVELDDMLRQRYEAIEHTPRVLDKPPGKLKIMRVKEPVEYGIAAQFRDLYQQSYGTVDTEMFYMDIGGVRKVILDEKVYYTLKALIIQNMSMSEEVAVACGTLFRDISTYNGENRDMITEQAMYEVLRDRKPESYAEGVLIKTINELCFSVSSTVLAWRDMSNSCGYYQYAIRKGEDYIVEQDMDDKTLKAFIRDNYKLAKADKEFMQKLVKDIPSKAVIAMIYFMREDEKMFEESSENLGFM